MSTIRSFRPFIIERLRDLWASAFAGYATAFVAGVIIAAIGLALVACANQGRGPASTAKPSTKVAAATVGEVATGIAASADRIDEQRGLAEAKAPDVAPESAAIGEETAKLRAMECKA